jgi:transposase
VLRQGNRQQMELLPPSIEQYIACEAPVRAFDAFVDSLNLSELGIVINPLKEGNPSYDPRLMLKLLIYGYSYGVRSSRKLERETYYNLSFIWLMGGLKPDHKTIAEFRRNNKEAIKRALVQCVRLCLKLNLIDGNILFVDGSKFRGNAGIKNTWTKEKGEKALKKAEKRIEEIIREADAIDEEEASLPSLTTLRSDLAEAGTLKERVGEIMAELQETDKKNLNTVDKECTRINSIHGTGAGYNAQIVVDDKNGLIVSGNVVSTNNDLGQFSVQIDKASLELGKKCRIAVADSGYAWTDDLGKIDSQGIQVIVPNQRIASGKKVGEFAKQNFRYDPENDCYTCPRGKVLKYAGLDKKQNIRIYRPEKKAVCLSCGAFGKCTRGKGGRRIMRLAQEELSKRLEEEYALPWNQAVYKRRQQKVELVFGHMRRNLGVQSFLLRGMEGAKAEVALLAVSFNLRRMLSLLGLKGLMDKIRELKDELLSLLTIIHFIFYPQHTAFTTTL